ncbi:Clp protease ClpP [Klebsiella oxytoca]|uniref:ClpP-like prohead protease/major capsid protein fusion protein n=1 Tax=Klebsiella oxytoca TaxID=571 RepID=UPI001DC145D6|nr:Clp protease ClpP [Klebsiella oxytoca]
MTLTPQTTRRKEMAKNKTWFRMQAKAVAGQAEIYIYDEIGFMGVTAKSFVTELKALGELSHIDLHINSPGGEVFEGIAIYNALKTTGAAITVHIDGLAASMASILAMVGNPVIMPENTMMMIHKPWGFAGGDANDMRDYANLLDQLENVMIPAYCNKTGKEAEEISAMLADETWLTAAECVALGFADQITPAVTAMNCIDSNRIKDYEKMPSSIRNMITRPKATTIPGNNPAPAPAPAVNTDAATIRAQVIAEQKARVNGIGDLFAMFGGKHQDILQACIADPECDVAQAKDLLLAALGKDSTPSNKAGGDNSHIYAGNGNFVGDGIRQALMARAGFENQDQSNAYNSMTLREYARMSLTERNIGVASLNPIQMVGAALTHSTSDFGNILLDVANKALLMGWDNAEETYDKWTKKGQLSDFKTATRVGMGAFQSLRKVREGAEYKYVTVGDKGENIALATYGEIFSITRQAIINDDLSALTDTPRKMGEAAKATIGDLVYAVLIDNPELSDDVPLFDKKHNNLTGGALSVQALDDARTLMKLQKEGERNLNIRPAFVLVPVALESKALQIIRSASVAGADVNAGVDNPIRNFAEVISDARLDANSSSAYYLAAAKGRDTIEVAYLNGIDTPYIDQQEGFNTDGIATKIRIDAGVAPLDYRGLAKSTGK